MCTRKFNEPISHVGQLTWQYNSLKHRCCVTVGAVKHFSLSLKHNHFFMRSCIHTVTYTTFAFQKFHCRTDYDTTQHTIAVSQVLFSVAKTSSPSSLKLYPSPYTFISFTDVPTQHNIQYLRHLGSWVLTFEVGVTKTSGTSSFDSCIQDLTCLFSKHPLLCQHSCSTIYHTVLASSWLRD